MMTDTSFFTFSVGRVETKKKDGSRLRPSGSVLVVFGLARAKQTLLPPGEAVYAPQSPYWPSKVGCASPAGAAGAAAVAAGLAGAAAARRRVLAAVVAQMRPTPVTWQGSMRWQISSRSSAHLHDGCSNPKRETRKQHELLGEFGNVKANGSAPSADRHNIQIKHVIPRPSLVLKPPSFLI